MANEDTGHTLQPTALAPEVWLRLVGNENQKWDGRGHFFAAAAEAMHRILIDRARRKRAESHGGDQPALAIHNLEIAAAQDDELLVICGALAQFAARDKPKAEFVELRYFFGSTLVEAAAADRPCRSLSHSPATGPPRGIKPQASDWVKLTRFPLGKTTLRRPQAFMS